MRLAEERQTLLRFAVSALLSLPLVIGILPMMLGTGHAWIGPWTQAALAAGVMLLSGTRFYREAFNAVRGGGANMAVLVSLGTSVAFFASLVEVVRGNAHAHLYFEAAAVVLTLVMLGKYLEARAKRGAGAALAALGRLQPARSGTGNRRWNAHGAGIGAHKRRCGSGQAGRALPVRRRDSQRAVRRSTKRWSPARASPSSAREGDTVLTGTINGEAALEVTVTRVGEDTQACPHGAAGRGSADRRRARSSASSTASRRSSSRSSSPSRSRPSWSGGWRWRSLGRTGRDDRRARHRLPLRARPCNADRAGGRNRLGGARGHPDPGYRDAGTRRQHRDRRLRQDRNADARPARRSPPPSRSTATQGRCSASPRPSKQERASARQGAGRACCRPRASTISSGKPGARDLRSGPVRDSRTAGRWRSATSGWRLACRRALRISRHCRQSLGSGGTLAFVLVDGKLVGGLRFCRRTAPGSEGRDRRPQ